MYSFLSSLMKYTLIMFPLMLLSLIALVRCSPLHPCPKCGTMNVPYPLSTNDDCGNPKYRVYCNKTTGLEFLSADGFYYKILSTNSRTNKLVIRPPVIEKDTCQSADFSVGGLRLKDDSPFNISSRNTVLLLNCSDNLLLSPLNCSSSSICRQFEEGEGACRGTLCCSYLKDASMTNHRIRVRSGGCTAYTSVVDYKPGASIDLWNYGVELQWLPPF